MKERNHRCTQTQNRRSSATLRRLIDCRYLCFCWLTIFFAISVPCFSAFRSAVYRLPRPTHLVGGDIASVQRDLGKDGNLLVEPAAGDSMQIVADHAGESNAQSITIAAAHPYLARRSP